MADAVTFCVLPSEKVAVTTNCCAVPVVNIGLVGARVRDVNACTFTDAEAPASPAVAVIVVAPVAWAFTVPVFSGALLTRAAEGLEEVQMTDCRVCVLPR